MVTCLLWCHVGGCDTDSVVQDFRCGCAGESLFLWQRLRGRVRGSVATPVASVCVEIWFVCQYVCFVLSKWQLGTAVFRYCHSVCVSLPLSFFLSFSASAFLFPSVCLLMHTLTDLTCSPTFSDWLQCVCVCARSVCVCACMRVCMHACVCVY